MSLPNTARLGSVFEPKIINTYDITTKKIVFTGSVAHTARFAKCHVRELHKLLATKGRLRKTYCFRLAKEKP
jgi:hypothetical protein